MQSLQTADLLFDPARLLAMMARAEMDAIVAHSRHHLFYLSGIDILDYAISKSSADFMLIPRTGIEEAVITLPLSEWIQLAPVSQWIPERIYTGQF